MSEVPIFYFHKPVERVLPICDQTLFVHMFHDGDGNITMQLGQRATDHPVTRNDLVKLIAEYDRVWVEANRAPKE